jgi:prevent-host-death family protein
MPKSQTVSRSWSQQPAVNAPQTASGFWLPGWPLATYVATSLHLFMGAIPARDLRNHTAEVLRRVESGEEIEVLKDNRPVAKIIPLSRRRQWLPAAEIGHELARLGPDTTGLADELRAVLTETTDDLPW